MPVRKNAALLSADDKTEYVEAVLKLKREGNPVSGRNYDFFVAWHLASIFERGTLQGARFWSVSHGVPAFLPWHRVYLLLFEQDLQAVSGNPDLAIPYWDIGAPDADTAIWTDEFMGGSGAPDDDDRVATGPFAFSSGNWELRVRNIDVEPDGALRRAFGLNVGGLPNVDTVRQVLAEPTYDKDPFDGSGTNSQTFRRLLEGGLVHGIGHAWVGGRRADGSSIGSMRNVWTSPNDPVFFLHHANIDRLWDKWQRMHPESDFYLPEAPIDGVPGSGLNEVNGFGWRNSALVDSTALGVSYDGQASDDAPVTEAIVEPAEPRTTEQPRFAFEE